MMPTQEINHADYCERLKTKTLDALRYIISDAHAAMEAMPQGCKAGYYQDEIHYAYAELQRRKGSRYLPPIEELWPWQK